MRSINEKVVTEVIKNEEKIEKLREQNPNIEQTTGSEEPFKLSKMARETCFEFLQENEVEISTWIGSTEDSGKVKNILKLWFLLNGVYNK